MPWNAKKIAGKPALGRALIRAKHNERRHGGGSDKHTTDMDDGFDWAKSNVRSITQETNLEEFLSVAELAGTEFTSEKENIEIVDTSKVGLISEEEQRLQVQTQDQNRHLLSVPRRPYWDLSTTKEELIEREKKEFLVWRRRLAEIQEQKGIVFTPFEKNLEFWRQLWRVVERSDVVTQIVDARNPLLFFCEDLKTYVNEVSPDKLNLLLLNKSDYLTEAQREQWAKYFDQAGIRVVFFSALEENAKLDVEAEGRSENDTDGQDDDDEEEADESDEQIDDKQDESERDVDTSVGQSGGDTISEPEQGCTGSTTGDDQASERLPSTAADVACDMQSLTIDEPICNSTKLLSSSELIDYFKNIKVKRSSSYKQQNLVTIGLVGYPNVGKSSTINAILKTKKVSVSATPGKTKHFQTLIVDPELTLCDCPGLVFPNFVTSKAEMVINGILPIDQLIDHVPSVNMVASLIPRHIFEDAYGIVLPQNTEKTLTSEELLNSYGFMRGFMTQRGLPDNPRSARYILKDFVSGKLLYCKAPPNVDQKAFHSWPERSNAPKEMTSQQRRVMDPTPSAQEFDKNFFGQTAVGAHSKTVRTNTKVTGSLPPKSWKKHENSKRKEKLRRVYAHLDA